MKAAVRRRTLNFFRQVLDSDEGRRILGDVLGGLTAKADDAVVLGEPPYGDLGHHIADGDTRPAPVFVTGRFRSGSTLLWNIFRGVPGCRAYYEPLNERRWFDPSRRGERIDRTHLGVEEYWREYDGLGHLAQWYREAWTRRALYMGERDVDLDLAAYLRALVDAAPERAVLQFNRVDFRLAWLRRQFPSARLIHLYRHPRDQWCSALVTPDAFPPSGTVEAFRASADHFYLMAWAADLAYWFPFLDERTTPHPYRLFYYIWRLSHAFGRRYAHASICYETLCAEPEAELARLMHAAGIAEFDRAALRSLIVPQKSRWSQYAPAAWFEAHEAACESVLETYFGAAGTAAPRAPI